MSKCEKGPLCLSHLKVLTHVCEQLDTLERRIKELRENVCALRNEIEMVASCYPERGKHQV